MMAAVWDNDEESLTELGLEECVESGMRERIVPCICACAGGTGKTKSAAASSSACRHGCMIKLQLTLLVDAPTFDYIQPHGRTEGPKA